MHPSRFVLAIIVSATASALVSPLAASPRQDPFSPIVMADTTDTGVSATTSAEAKLQLARFSPAKMDPSVDPRVDFLKFAAGKWYANTKIPADKSRWGGFDELSDANWARIRSIVEDAAKQPGDVGSVRQKVGDFFASALDTARINELGLKPIADELKAIGAVRSVEELMHRAVRL